MNAVPTVGAVYDRPQSVGLHSSELWAVIDRPYSCEDEGARKLRSITDRRSVATGEAHGKTVTGPS
jgi:hypothetical protein